MEKILEWLEASVSFSELAWVSEEQKQSWGLLKPGSFNMHRNATIPMIVMLDCLEVDIEISDTNMETIESDDCREILIVC